MRVVDIRADVLEVDVKGLTDQAELDDILRSSHEVAHGVVGDACALGVEGEEGHEEGLVLIAIDS